MNQPIELVVFDIAGTTVKDNGKIAIAFREASLPQLKMHYQQTMPEYVKWGIHVKISAMLKPGSVPQGTPQACSV